MSPTDGTIWIDITDLSHWRGPLTGIQRTTFHIGQEFAKQPNVRFFAVTKDLQFVPAPFPEANSFGERIKPAEKWGKQDLAKAADLSKKVMRAIYERVLPNKVSSFSTRSIKALREIYRDTRFRLKNPALRQDFEHPFVEGDTVIILGASWSWQGMMHAIYAIRRSMPIKLVATVYDLIPVHFPHFFGPGFGQFFTNYLSDTLYRCDAVLSISENTTKDIKTFLHEMEIPDIPVVQFRLGDDPHDDDVPSVPVPALAGQEYILAVGTVEIRKNYMALYNAWALAADKGISLPKLVIVGRPGWLVTDLIYQIFIDPRIGKRIEILEDVDDASLAWLYQNCLFSVYPSWYEGWGLPIAESVRYGKMCVTSATSSMQEIAGNLLEYAEPSNPESFLEKIQFFVENRKELAKREKRIQENYRPVTWEESFVQLWPGLLEAVSND